jgi:transposase
MRVVPLPEPDPVVAAAVRKKYAGKKKAPLAVEMRDRLGEWMTDGLFAEAFGARGRPGLPPAMLAVVTVLQFAYDMDDRDAAEAVETRLDWQYALGLPLDCPGFDHSVLSEFRARVAGHGLEQAALDALLARLAGDGLVKARGKQRTDSTHVTAAVRALHTTELAGESVRAALEALAAACPDWLAARLCTADWTRRYGARVGSWRPPSGKARDELAITYARDGYALVSACYEDSAPAWARQVPAVQVLRTVLVQNFHLDIGEDGREAIRRREAGRESGLPPGHARIASPYDADASWGAKRDLLWLGYKLHISETCQDAPDCGCGPGPRTPACRHDTLPNLVTHVATTSAAVADADMTIPVTAALAAKGLPPARHYLDSGYASAAAVLEAARQFGVTLVTPLPADTSRQARQAGGYDRSAFTIDYDARTATCPQGHASRYWNNASTRGRRVVLVQFDAADCRPCPARAQCTTALRGGRGLTLLPREQHELQAAARAAQPGKDWQDDYKRRAGIEATISQAVTVTGCRRARYRSLAKTRLEHAYSAVALNLWRLHAYWNDTPIDRTRTTHLARLDLSLRDGTLTTE